MILFFDRNVGTTIPKILQTRRLKFPVPVEYHQDHFPQEEQDDKWLEVVGKWGWTVIGQDHMFHARANELEAIKQHTLGVFYLWGIHAPAWQTLRCLARAYDKIIEAEANTLRPFIYDVSRMGRLKRIL